MTWMHSPRCSNWSRTAVDRTSSCRHKSRPGAAGCMPRRFRCWLNAGEAPARSTPIEDLPRSAVAAAEERTGGIKQATIGTTVYLLPEEHKRLKRLALDLDLPTVHELLLTGIDRLLREQGEPPLVRY